MPDGVGGFLAREQRDSRSGDEVKSRLIAKISLKDTAEKERPCHEEVASAPLMERRLPR